MLRVSANNATADNTMSGGSGGSAGNSRGTGSRTRGTIGTSGAGGAGSGVASASSGGGGAGSTANANNQDGTSPTYAGITVRGSNYGSGRGQGGRTQFTTAQIVGTAGFVVIAES
jgi:hypothetical protein